MGWLYQPGQTREGLIRMLIEPYDGPKALHEPIAGCLRGNVLWSVVQVTAKEDLGWIGAGEVGRFIRCDLLDGSPEGWGYKEMCESMGPYYYTCPLEYLRMVPVADIDWRKKVFDYHGKPFDSTVQLSMI